MASIALADDPAGCDATTTRAEIPTVQAIHTLKKLHAELAGKIDPQPTRVQVAARAVAPRGSGDELVNTVFNINRIPQRRGQSNLRFERGLLFRKAVDILREAERPMAFADLAKAVVAANHVKVRTRARFRAWLRTY